jgi:thiamine pyrophosphate-dependent acetolactate synthase large subunit-like protein
VNGGQIIAGVLRQYGVTHLYTLCGGHISPIYVEAEKQGIRIVDVRDEASAVFGADASARLTGIPGVAAVTAGPGVTNAITALKNAQMAQTPLLLLGGATATLLRGRGALQDIDQMALVRPHVKLAARVTRLKDMAPAMHRAMAVAQSGVPGPVFLEMPVDLLYDEPMVREMYGQKSAPAKSLAEKARNWYINRHVNRLFSGVGAGTQPPGQGTGLPGADAHSIQKALQAIRQSEKPLLIISSGAILSPQLALELAEAVKKLGIPVYLSGMARGLLGRDHPLQFRHNRKQALREADCILLLGVPVDFRLDYGFHLNRKAIKIAVNRSRKELRKNLRPDLAVQTDPASWLIAVAAQAGHAPEWIAWKAALKERENAREASIDETAAQEVTGINPVALFRTWESLLPQHSVLIADGGDFAATAAYTLRPRNPLGWLDPGAFGTLGVGGGFALGAALQYPDHYIWIIYGDGSAAYSLIEFDTFRKMGLKVCAVIGNNGSWEQIARDQIPMLGTATATVLPKSDYHKVAEAFGAAGERVETLADFEGALSRAIASMDSRTPYLINAIIGSTAFRQGSISM